MATTRELLVISVTRLSTGACVACVDERDRWVRPTREQPNGWRQLDIADLRNAKGDVVVKVGNLVRWPLGSNIPRDCHSEDVLMGRGLPQLVRTLPEQELESRCDDLCEADYQGFLRDARRSLTIIRPTSVEWVSFEAKGKGGITARVGITHGQAKEDLAITDLAWRARGRELLQANQPSLLRWSPSRLLSKAQLEVRFLAIGKGQAWEEGPQHPVSGQHWPFVVTMFTHPPNNKRINYQKT
jgi:hypothetical protein